MFAGYNKVKDYFVYGVTVRGYPLVKQDLLWSADYLKTKSGNDQFVKEMP